ncbi:MAG: hypothetical protein AAGA76_13590 [Pseudomonadota bacterium]
METVALSAPVNPGFAFKQPAENSLVQKVHGCHANIRYNYVDEIGEEARHRHRGNSCRVEIIESHSNNNHCHADGRKHHHRNVGSKVHSHVGNSCRVDVWNQSGGSGSGQGCIKVGPVLFCP